MFTHTHTQVVLERLETVPFRLTRNMFTFFTAFGVEGVFVTAMVNAAQVGAIATSIGYGSNTLQLLQYGLCLLPFLINIEL